MFFSVILFLLYPALQIPKSLLEPFDSQMDGASATETVDSGSIPGIVKPKTLNIGIHGFPA